ncbi:threonine--tRNA ligase [Candidatus Woesebacteria bacterium]|nr:threonine--tRNA ligase [Candidatus Woesebacteria bacterium]
MSQSSDLPSLRHSCAHLLAAAVTTLWPNALATIGPATDDGFYYDFDFGDETISESDFKRIENTMEKVVQEWRSFEGREVTVLEAQELFKDNPYKLELINELAEKGEKITVYQSGQFVDLCRGGHDNEPYKNLRFFKLMSVAGAYWRGSEKNKMLTRIYGTAFETKKELEDYLTMLVEAKKRDHRKLGTDLELFFIDDMVGKGLVMWLPKGTIVRDEIEKLARQKELEYGYQRVVTPHIAKEELFTTSGHLPYYKDSMYPPMIMDDGTYYLKAMNCPHHHRIFCQKPRSYRDMPLRLAEYGICYRNELSGTLSGLLRVRGMAMNDAHIYCRKDQIKDEFKKVIDLTLEYFSIFNLKDYWFRLSLWSPEHTDKYIDEPQNWAYSEQVIRELLTEMNLPFKEIANEAAFYGPKVDVQFRSAVGREETMSTIQLDFAAKGRFGLKYTDNTGAENNDVFVIHRAPLSVHERFMAFLIEHYAGAFPLWLAPVQVSLLPLGETHVAYAQQVLDIFRSKGIRVELDADAKSIGAKIRHQTLQKVPYMGIMGDKELESKTISVRTREGKDLGVVSVDSFIQQLISDIENRT